MSVAVNPGKQRIDPLYRTAEPSIGADWFSPEAQDKVAELVFAEGQPHVHEEDVLISVLMGMLDGMPDGQFPGTQGGKRLPSISGIHQVGLASRVEDR